MAEAFGPAIAVPALVALGLATATRRPRLAVAAGTVVALNLVWLDAELRQAAPAGRTAAASGSPAAEAARLRLFSANVLFTNTDLDGIASEVRDADPDVVLLQEVSPPTLAGLARAGILDRYPHRSLVARPDPLGTAILSRLPLEDVERFTVAGLPMARATVVAGDRRLRLYNVHTRAPFGPGGQDLWQDQLEALTEVVDAEDGPLVLAGDFNAASGHAPFRSLLAAGVRDAHMVRRRWWATTWPSDLRFGPPFARIDHVLVSRNVAVLDVAEGIGRGSDHRPVVADLAIGD
jgi:endonuclease/exonuclease/phosphatase (EEP) superfamily protein YafD